MQIMEKLLFTLKAQDIEDVNDRVIQKMRLAALLHDCGHLPFSHSLEKRGTSIDHEELGDLIIKKSIVGEILNDNGVDPVSIGGLIQQKPNDDDEDFTILVKLIPLIHSNADVDRMDYLLRDGYYTGVPFGKIDFERICSSIAIESHSPCTRIAGRQTTRRHVDIAPRALHPVQNRGHILH